MAAIKADGPTYPLVDVLRLAKLDGSRRLTGRGEQDARDQLGLFRADVFRIVGALRSSDFYKTMPAELRPGTYQDVYRPFVVTPLYQAGVVIYCKVQIVERLIVISFKRWT